MGRKPAVEITATQKKTFMVIENFIRLNGFPPTIKELAEALGISHSSAHEQVVQLAQKGFIKRDQKKARSIVILRKP